MILQHNYDHLQQKLRQVIKFQIVYFGIELNLIENLKLVIKTNTYSLFPK